MDRAAVLNAFSPAQEMYDPERFAGRSLQIRELTDALRIEGSVPVIYGDRGLGKSSTAIQLQLIAMGRTELLTHLDMAHLALPEDQAYLTFYVTCTEDVETLQDLQRLILHKLEAVDIVEAEHGSDEVLVDRSSRRKLSFKFFETETTKRYAKRSSRLRNEELTPAERLEREMALLVSVFKTPLLIIVDELDRARGLGGLSTYLKAASNDLVKFVLVGIGQTLSDLLVDHTSLGRMLYPVRIPQMTSGELADVVDKAMNQVAADGIDLRFSSTARSRIVRAAGGFPWFVHAIGQEALASAMDRGQVEVTEDDIVRASRDLTSNRFAQQFSDGYQLAVRDSYAREIVLRAFAAWPRPDIPTAEVYRICKRLGVANPAVYKGHLTNAEYGEPLVAPRLQNRGLVRFRNEMFKHYIDLSTSLFAGVAEKVGEATTSW